MRVAEADGTTVVHHATVTLETACPLQIVDITPLVESVVQRAGLWDGLVCVATRHTTAGLLVNEHEPLLGDDLAAMFERLAPASGVYAHDDFTRRQALPPGERRNGHAHCRAALLRASETLPVSGGVLTLGRWQRLLFVDCDGGQRRQVSVVCLGRSGPTRSPAPQPWPHGTR